jgi:hypothetical protein
VIVYCVRPEDPTEQVAAFEREEDADAFARTYDDGHGCWPMVECVTVADAETAAKMIGQRLAADLSPDMERVYDDLASSILRNSEILPGESPRDAVSRRLASILTPGAQALVTFKLEALIASLYS